MKAVTETQAPADILLPGDEVLGMLAEAYGEDMEELNACIIRGAANPLVRLLYKMEIDRRGGYDALARRAAAQGREKGGNQ